MAYNYTQYVVDLANFLVIPSNDPNYQTALPNIIDDAEQRLYRELDLLSTIIRDSSASLTPNSRSFTFPQDQGRIVVSESINVFYPLNSTNRVQLVPVSREFIDWMWGNETATTTPSVPQYYGMITDQQIIVGPPPDAAYKVEVIGTIRPTPLSATNPTTFLTLYLSDLFFAESMIIGYSYLKDFGATTDDPQGSMSWNKHYQDLWQSANTEETRKKYQAQAWTSKQPQSLSTPPRV